MAEIITGFLQVVAKILDAFAGVVVAYGAISAFYNMVIRRVPEEMQHAQYARTRIALGRKLVVGLEFLLGADILRTAITPTWSRLGIVAALIVLRTALNYFLERDIEHLERQQTLEEVDASKK